MSPFTSDLNGSNNMMSYPDSMPLMARGNASHNANRSNSNINNNNDNNESDNSSGCDNMSLLSRCRRNINMGAGNLMSYQNMLVMLTVLVCGLATVNGLKCNMCGQYNEGVGSITPCLNYSDQYAHLYLKECSKKSEKYCVVSETPIQAYTYLHMHSLFTISYVGVLCVFVTLSHPPVAFALRQC